MATHRKRIRNKPSLEDKIRVIKAFSTTPYYKTLSNIFKCSRKQIEYIINDKNNILAQHALLQGRLVSPEKIVHNLDYTKIELIDRVMCEWYHRAKCYPTFKLPITYRMIREKVLDARRALNIANFIPTNAWLVNFRKHCDRRPPAKQKGHTNLLSLDMTVIANFVLQKLGVTEEQIKSTYGVATDDWKAIHVPSEQEQFSTICPVVDLTMTEIKSGPVDVTHTLKECRSQDNVFDPMSEDDEKGYRFIKSSEDALKYLRPLEEFVLLKENFRAIGLIIQLEAIFLKTSK